MKSIEIIVGMNVWVETNIDAISECADVADIEFRRKSLLRPPPQKSIFVQESPNELKFIGYVGGIM